MNILVLNPGSSTLKLALYQIPDSSKASIAADSAAVLANGIIEPIRYTAIRTSAIRGDAKACDREG